MRKHIAYEGKSLISRSKRGYGQQMSQENGHSMNGHGRGTKGDAAPAPRGTLVRSSLNATRKLAENGMLATDHIARSVEVAIGIVNGNGTERDKLAAMKVLTALAKYSSEAELELDKLRRLDAGEATDRTETVTVEYPEGRRMWTE